MSFQCQHCGQCCQEAGVQTNLSIADIYRICQFLNCSVEQIKSKIGMTPFLNENNCFDYELGLNRPCRFRVEQRCSIYPARPLNCRIFPFPVLDKPLIDPYFSCLKAKRKCSLKQRKTYQGYVNFIGNLILKEAELTEQFYQKNNIKQTREVIIDLPEFLSERKAVELKIRAAMALIDPNDYHSLINQIERCIEQNKSRFVSAQEINERERNLFK